MVNKTPVPAKPDTPGFEPSVDDICAMCERAKLPSRSPSMYAEIAEALGHMARMLAQRLYLAGQPITREAEQEQAFWQAMDLLDFALPGLHPLYGLLRVHIPGRGEPDNGHGAFERLMGAMQVASKFVPRTLGGPRPAYDEKVLCLSLFALYEHAFEKASSSPSGPAPRFIQEGFRLVAGVEISTGAIHQKLLDARTDPDQ